MVAAIYEKIIPSQGGPSITIGEERFQQDQKELQAQLKRECKAAIKEKQAELTKAFAKLQQQSKALKAEKEGLEAKQSEVVSTLGEI